MTWRDYCKGFAIEKIHCDWEGKALCVVGFKHQIPYHLIYDYKQVPDGWVPCGTLKWIENILGEVVVPDYYPQFLRPWISRKIWKEEKWPLGKRVFIKPSDRHKRFTGFITSGTYRKKKRGPYWCSEIVSFQNEWRYYVAYGKLIGAYWYWGIGDDPVDPPKIEIDWPFNWCGTADFGILPDGKIELIESHPPYACGWYGKKHEEYAEFLTLGWKWLKEKHYNKMF